ncbi:hypothetical protein ACFRFJ_16135 [Streptomyces hydrogenans]|uniref:DUF6197 family protein n=1 Tax=Streptomyces hydrogenans TaxID=1873719 RepID=UPI0036756285
MTDVSGSTALAALDAWAVRHLQRPESWFGASGTKVTGEAVAAHLQAAAALMKRENWDPQLYAPSSCRTLYYALIQTAADGQGDDDTRDIIRDLLSCVLASATGAPYVYYEAWNEHATRTLHDVLLACDAAAAVARQYGPGPLAAPPQVEPGQNR